jgi:hypothetical protein
MSDKKPINPQLPHELLSLCSGFRFLALSSEEKLGVLLRHHFPEVEAHLLEQVFGLESGTIKEEPSEAIKVEEDLKEQQPSELENSTGRSHFTLGMGGDVGDGKEII